MNIVFIGCTTFGMKCLEKCLLLESVNITGIITNERKFKISYSEDRVKNFLYKDFSKIAEKNNLNFITMKNGMKEKELFKKVKKWNPDMFLVVGWYHIIPKEWLEYAPAYGLHASLLPEYSGGAPLVWAMINGEKKTGISLFKMANGVDDGPILDQKEEIIKDDDTIKTLYERIEKKGINLLLENLPKLAKNKIIFVEQNCNNRKVMPQRSPEDGLIDWNKNAIFVDRFIRAQTRPYPGAFTFFEGKKIHIWAAKNMTNKKLSQNLKIGMICKDIKGNFFVKCGDSLLKLFELSYKNEIYKGDQIAKIITDKMIFSNEYKN